MEKDDLLFILDTAADLSGHQDNGPVALARTQEAVKGYIADKKELQDPDVLNAIDSLLKISSAAQVPGVFRPTSLDLTDYVDPEPEPEPEPEPGPAPESVQLPPPEAEVQEAHPPSSTEADDSTKALPTVEPKE